MLELPAVAVVLAPVACESVCPPPQAAIVSAAETIQASCALAWARVRCAVHFNIGCFPRSASRSIYATGRTLLGSHHDIHPCHPKGELASPYGKGDAGRLGIALRRLPKRTAETFGVPLAGRLGSRSARVVSQVYVASMDAQP
jgi:hypothetical protein